MRFRQFINEYGFNFNQGSLGADVRHGYWNLPSTHPGTVANLQAPPGGYPSFGNMLQHGQQIKRANDPLYIELETLGKFSGLAEAAGIALSQRQQGQQPNEQSNRFKYADIDPRNRMLITGLRIGDIVSSAGGSVTLRYEDLRRGIELGILKKEQGMAPSSGMTQDANTSNDPYMANLMAQLVKTGEANHLYSLDVNILRNRIERARKELENTEYSYQLQQHLVGGVDRGMGQFFGQGAAQAGSSIPRPSGDV